MLTRAGCALADVRRRLADGARQADRGHRRPLWTFRVRSHHGLALCEGRVYDESDARCAIAAVAGLTRVRLTIDVLTRPGRPREILRPHEHAHLFSEPGPDSDPVAIVVATDPPARVLADHDDMLLVDVGGVRGWTFADDWRPAVWRPALDCALGDTLAEAVECMVGIPYVRGGTSMRGVDCSGLVWRASLDSTGIPVPRHSRDQLAACSPVSSCRLAAGTLAFASAVPEGPFHVGVLVSHDEVVHASTTRARVVREPLARFCDRAGHVTFGRLPRIQLDGHDREQVERP